MQVSTTRSDVEPATRGLLAGLALGVAVLAGVAFAPALSAGFVSWDDGLTVTDNYAIRGLGRENLRWMWTTSHAGHYQPLSWTSLALDHARLGLSAPDFPEARGFHATNLLLHIAGAVALYALALALLTRACLTPGSAPTRGVAVAAALAALLHAVHPLRCESVCWVTERRDVLSLPFLLLALLAWLRATPSGPVRALRPGWLALCAAGALAALGLTAASVSLADPRRLALRGPGAAGLVLGLALSGVSLLGAARGVDAAASRRRGAWLLAAHALLLTSLLAKAWGIVLPALLLLLDVWPLRRLPLGAGGASPPGRWRALAALGVEKLPSLVLALGFARLAHWAQTAQQGELDVLGLHTPGERLIQALYGLAFYPAKTLLPTGLAPLYPVPDDLSLAEPRFLIGALATLALCALAAALARRAPAVSVAFVAYALSVAPVLGVLQSGPQLVADRYAYLAGIPFALLAGGALQRAWRRGQPWRAAGTAVACAAVVALAAQSWRQCAIWRDSEALWTHAYAHAPDSPLAALNLGLVRAARAQVEGDPARRSALRDEALRLVREAAARRPGSGLYQINEAIVLADRAAERPEPERSGDLTRAADLAAQAIARAETQGLVEAAWYFQHGRILATAGRGEEAAFRFERALALRPEWPVPRLWLAALLLDAAQRQADAAPAQASADLARALRELDAATGTSPETRSIAAARARAAALRAELEARKGAVDAP
jgi:hypothetical protein